MDRLPLNSILCRLFANHRKIDVSARDLARAFGGNRTQYLHASVKMKEHLRTLKAQPLARLDPYFRNIVLSLRNDRLREYSC